MELDFAITGGIAKNIGVVRRVEKLMGVTALQGSYDSKIAGALGGALMAYDLLEKRKRRGQRS
jgi:activator of 2-hydroxyglutaryl-CoA dehydratase